MNTHYQSKQIIIIGAGLAGLAAYHQLRQYGFNVTILEARNRAGGRIHTNNSLGIPLNAGAGWIHGIDHNPMAELANNLHIAMKVFDYHLYNKYDHNGHLISQEMTQQFEDKFNDYLQQAKTLAFKSDHDVPLSDALAKVIRLQDLNDFERALFQTKCHYFEGYVGASYEFLSGRYWNLEQQWPGENCLLTGSYQPIIELLARDCPIHFNTVVKEINLRNNDVEVVTDHSNFYSDAIVITLPLGVLKKNRVIFHPSLPTFKQHAIQQLGMGLLNVTFIKFPTVFWPSDCHAFSLNRINNLSIPIFFNMDYFLKQPILMGYHGGERTKRIENLTEKELEHIIMRDLKKQFGNEIPKPEALMTTRWSQDAFSCGSFSYVPVGASASDFDAMAQPIANRLFFAGEATNSSFFATTHGAYLSGIREANKIKQCYDASN